MLMNFKKKMEKDMLKIFEKFKDKTIDLETINYLYTDHMKRYGNESDNLFPMTRYNINDIDV